MRMTSGPDGGQRRFVALASRLATLIVVAVVLLLGTAVGVMAALTADGSSRCQHAFVPAYFYAAGTWSQADQAKPSVMILDISGLGAGSAPVPHFRSVVSQAQAAGVTILGYSSTAYGLRPAAAVEADARDYKAWYGVTGVSSTRSRGSPASCPITGSWPATSTGSARGPDLAESRRIPRPELHVDGRRGDGV